VICVTERGKVIPCETSPSAMSVISDPKFIVIMLALLLVLAYTSRVWWRMWSTRQTRA
jgi:hypothetical protein